RGTYREIEKDESEVVVDIYRRFGAERTGYLERAPVVWDIGLLGVPPKGGLCCTVAYEEAGEALGYVIYTVESKPGEDRTEPNQVVWIRDFAWLTASAYRALWQFFAPMDLVRRVGGMGPDDDPLPHLLMEPRMLNSTKWDGLLGRIVDVEKALPKRGYQEEGTLVFEVLDEICSWNRGRWKLETSSEGAVVRKTSADPEVALPISTLAMLVFGQISATEAWRMGRLDVFDQSALPSWDRVLRTKYRPFCPDVF
ncbi:MAG: hypothetical protein GY866_33845, partial [Proteobacteria bacterium]|nr:hypothetical protein [Pseudomonadota bacterium]